MVFRPFVTKTTERELYFSLHCRGRWVTKMMDRHGDDFAAMSRDPDNIFQLTANKIRRKVTKFISVPEQFEPYAKERGLLDDAKKILDGEGYEDES